MIRITYVSNTPLLTEVETELYDSNVSGSIVGGLRCRRHCLGQRSHSQEQDSGGLHHDGWNSAKKDGVN